MPTEVRVQVSLGLRGDIMQFGCWHLVSVVLVLNASATGGMEPSFARLLPVGITLSAFGALFSVVILRRGRTIV